MVSDPQWLEALSRVLADPEGCHRLVLQPVVDLARGEVAGYEALSRFRGPLRVQAERWFAAALRLGWADELEAMVVRRAVAARRLLPARRFLTVNVTPTVLGSPALDRVLAGAGDLGGLVLELTETEPFDDLDALAAALAPWRAAGAAVALDDAGTGYAGLRQLSHLRPELVKLDRSLVAGIDRDPVKQALAETLGAFTGRLDAWLLAEGVERTEELDVVAALGIPLAQGFALGRPAAEPVELEASLARRLRGFADRRTGDRVGALLEPVPAALDEAEARRLLRRGGGETAVVLSPRGVPERLLLRVGARVRAVPVTLSVLAEETVADVVTRAVTRPVDVRFDPLVCVDDRSMLLGVVRVERLALALADRVREPSGGGRTGP